VDNEEDPMTTDPAFDYFRDLQERSAREPLDPELVPYLHEHDGIGTVLQHPLVYVIPFIEAMDIARANDMLAYKRDALRKAAAEGEYGLYVFLHERPYRSDALNNIAYLVDDEEYWELVSDVWRDTENLWQWGDKIDRILGDEPEETRRMMDDDDRQVFDALPDTIEVFRGYDEQFEDTPGWSWTLDHERARWFARRWSARAGHEPRVAVGEVAKANVAAYIGGRNEAEIIVNPKHVTVRRTDVPEPTEEATE
jgi:hypothetical protein